MSQIPKEKVFHSLKCDGTGSRGEDNCYDIAYLTDDTRRAAAAASQCQQDTILQLRLHTHSYCPAMQLSARKHGRSVRETNIKLGSAG